MKKIFIVLLTFAGMLGSCTKDFSEMNSDDKNPTEVKGEYLFSKAQKELSDQVSSTSVNLNVWKIFVQYWTETTYTDEANYDILKRNIPGSAFSAYYRKVLAPMAEAEKIILADNSISLTPEKKANMVAIIELHRVYTFHNLVNIFGNVPYFDASDVNNISPKYTDAVVIYKDLIKRIDDAIVVLNKKPEAGSFDGADLIYHGSVTKWITFANSLKLKIAINQSDVNVLDTKKVIEEAIAGGVLASANDNALLVYQGTQPNTNPLFVDLVASGRQDFVPTRTLVDLMSSKSDARMDAFFNPESKIKGAFKGGVYGNTNAYDDYSHITNTIMKAEFAGMLITYSEVQFYLAEASARGLVSGAAKDYYDAGITASFSFWGVEGAADYILANAYNSANWKQSIAEQSYLANYTRGLVAYNNYRRLDFPIMEKPVGNGVNLGVTSDNLVPRRFTYPVNEQTLNKVNYQAAAKAVGGDKMETKLFWDKN
ncbi:MAG: SusD/RagB family nutrient-binding outer membrane lipoprotein [Ichthyobacteriaceae bacterium]|nr:SusD/RagB family nutrient-binding outer membrane lipoprotein [Ichthyobacteriaceae bacterium]